MKPSEIREMTPEELDRAIESKRKEIFDMRLKIQTGQFNKTASIRLLRKDIARLETEKTARRNKAQ